MGNIILLDDLTINKIAAGEVIERPASAVKELIENSIDAGATSIIVEIKNGGISYIRITDNGKGILPDDMEIAFERHATSKIRVAQDIETVKSMGFRGEALASIAAISRVTMTSKTEQNYTGNQIIIEGGNVIAEGEIGCADGTSITIENLFYNTPVRYKFLKKDFTEAGYIEDVIERIALVHPEISIKFVNTGKTVISTSGNGDIRAVIYAIYGKDIAENTININYEYENMKITGVVGKPEIARSNRSNQIFFVNKRYVKDKILTVASEQAFKNLIPAGKYGFIILNIEMDPSKVDVNVHPAKLEVRFQEEQNVFKAIYNAISNALSGFSSARLEFPKQSSDWNMETRYGGYGLASRYIENNANNEGNYFSKEVGAKQEYENSWNKSVAQTFDENEIQREENEKQKGLFKRFLNRKEKEEEPTIIEQLYQAKKQETAMNSEGMSNFNGIMQKMAEMQRSVREFNESQERNGERDGANIEQEQVETSNLNFEQGVVLENSQIAEQGRTLANGSMMQQGQVLANEQAISQEQANNLGFAQGTVLVNEPIGEQGASLLNGSVGQYEQVVTNELAISQEQTNALGFEQVAANEQTISQEQTNNLGFEHENVLGNTTIAEQETSLENGVAVQKEPSVANELTVSQEQTNNFDFEQGVVLRNAAIAEQEASLANDSTGNQEQSIPEKLKYNQEQAVASGTTINYKSTPAIGNSANTQKLPYSEYNTNYKQENTKNQQNNFEEMYATIFGTKQKNATLQVNEEPETYTIPKTDELTIENLSLFETTGESNVPKYKYIGNAFDHFALIELGKELYILDQVAANERIIYEELKHEYEYNGNKNTQQMLLPDVISLTPKQMLIVEDNKETFEKGGFELEEFGQNTIKLTGVPNICMNLDTEELFLEILEQINKVARTDGQAIEEKFLTTVASKIAQNSTYETSTENVKQIVERLIEEPSSFTTNSEKQVIMRLTKADIEKKFSRR